jgi:hypothetical protein
VHIHEPQRAALITITKEKESSHGTLSQVGKNVEKLTTI